MTNILTKPTYENFLDCAKRAKQNRIFLIVIEDFFTVSDHELPNAKWQMNLGKFNMDFTREGYEAILVLAGFGG